LRLMISFLLPLLLSFFFLFSSFCYSFHPLSVPSAFLSHFSFFILMLSPSPILSYFNFSSPSVSLIFFFIFLFHVSFKQYFTVLLFPSFLQDKWKLNDIPH
jgi:hypothetical protein